MSSYDAQLVKVIDTKAVFLVVNGQSCWVQGPDDYKRLFGDNGNLVQDLTQAQFDTIPAGSQLAANAYVATITGTFPYYLMNGQAQQFASPQVFATYPFDAANIQQVSIVTIEQAGLGALITS